MAQGDMQLLSLNVAMPASFPWRGGILRTAIDKRPVDGRRRLERLNIEGDGQADLEAHGGPHQAVYAYPQEHYARWARELGRDDLRPGQFGENFTVRGLDEAEVCIGDVYRVGEALLQVSQPRAPCFKLARKMGQPDFVKAFTASGRCGFYLRVLQPGTAGAGDAIHLLARDSPRMSVRAIFRLRYTERKALTDIARAAQLEALAPQWRAEFARHVAAQAAPAETAANTP